MAVVGESVATSVYDSGVEQLGLSQTHRCLLSLVPPRVTVLELGPSSGYMTKVLSQRGCTVDAIEANPKDAEKAAQYCRKMVVGSAEEHDSYTQLADSYDVVLMADLLEHLRSPELALAEVRKRLSSNGCALVSLPNIAHWKMRLDLLRGRFEYTDLGLLDRTHLRFYTLKTAKELFAAAGMRVEDVLVPPPTYPRFGRAKEWVKTSLPTLFALQVVYVMRPV